MMRTSLVLVMVVGVSFIAPAVAGVRTLLVIEPSEERPRNSEGDIVPLKDGRLWMYMRTGHGFQYGCYSSDEGVTWSQPAPTNLASPLSPATVERVPWTGDLLCVWNDYSETHVFPEGRRTPLCIAVSKDQGHTWSQSRVIEGDPDGWCCYTSMTFVDDRVLLSYCAGDKQVGGLNRLKVSAITKDWLYASASTMVLLPTDRQK